MGEFFLSILAALVLIVLWLAMTAAGVAVIVLVLRAFGIV